MSDKHTADVNNINEGDTVTLETGETLIVEAECATYSKHNARDPEVVQEDRTWYFQTQEGDRLMLQITEGLKRFEWEAEYPRHKQLYNITTEEELGYVEDVQIHGKMEA